MIWYVGVSLIIALMWTVWHGDNVVGKRGYNFPELLAALVFLLFVSVTWPLLTIIFGTLKVKHYMERKGY